MKNSVVAARYGRALVEIVLESRSAVKAQDVNAQLGAFEEMLAGSPDLKGVLETPAISLSRKKAVAATLAEKLGMSGMLKNFLFVLLDHKRILDIGAIRESFNQQMDEHLGIVQAEITSAAPLTESQKRSLEAELQRMSGKQVRLHTRVDANLLGGVQARLGSTLYDGSLLGLLEGMRRKLTSESADYKAGI